MEGENGSAISPPLAASARWNPSSDQLAILETLYNDGLRTPSPEQIREITERLNEYGRIEAKNVFYWFQNHKARERQKERQENMPFPGGLVPNPRPDVLGSPLYLQAPQVVQAPQVMQAPQVGHPAGFYQYPPQYYPPAPVNGMQMTEMPPPPPPWLRENPTAPVNRMQMTEMPPPAPWMRENAAAGVNRMQMTEMPPPPPWMRENAAAAVNRRQVAQMAPPPWMRLFNKRRPPVANSSVPAYLQGTPLDPNFIRNQELLMHAANPRPAPTHRTLDLFPQHPTGILKEKFAGSSQATASVEEPEGNSNEGGEDVGGQAKMSMFDFFGTSPRSN